MTLTSFMVYITTSHNLDQPNKSYNRKKTNIKTIVPKWIKPQIINPQSYKLSHQTLTTSKTPI